MKIMIVQSIPDALSVIEKRIKEVFPLLDNVIYEGSFEKALQVVPKDDDVVVITSDMFHDDKNELFTRQEKDGSKLAEEIKKINPKAKVYVFSTYTPRPHFVDGFFPKTQMGNNTGAEIIKIFLDLNLQ